MLRRSKFSFPSRAYVGRSQFHHYRNPLVGFCIARMATEATQVAKKDGTIADVFTTLGPSTNVAPLPARFSAVKKDVLRDMGVASEVLEMAWKGVLKALEPRVQEIISQGGNVRHARFVVLPWNTQFFVKIIPRISYGEVKNGLSESQRDAIRRTGVVVITEGVPKEVSIRGHCTMIQPSLDVLKQLEGSAAVETPHQRLYCS